MGIRERASEAREASLRLAVTGREKKDRALVEIARAIFRKKAEIMSASARDVRRARKEGLGEAMLKRLLIDDRKIDEMRQYAKGVAGLDDPVGRELSVLELDKGLTLHKVSVPIGVIGVVFESRPDVLVQISSLCLKSGNAVMLKGGSEARESNAILFSIVKDVSDSCGLPAGWIQFIETREDVGEMLRLDDCIDLVIPRGSGSFVRHVMENTRIPVLGHSEGVCHVYVDRGADLRKAERICFDSKCQYPAVCNAMETLLIHRDVAEELLPILGRMYSRAGVELRGDDASRKILSGMKHASAEDWETEYDDLVLSVRVVDGLDEAIDHINRYGSRHTDAIVTEDRDAAGEFMGRVDSSSVVWNASTRFADGSRYGLGAEIGISTGKIHARGPVGMEGLMTYKHKLLGDGHVVAPYCSDKPRRFTHR